MDEEDDLRIRRVKEEELPELVQVYKSAYHQMVKYAYTSERKIRNYLRWLYEGDPGGFWIAEKKGRPVGFVCLHSEWEDWKWGSTGELHELVVHKDFQGQGIGKKLLNKALEYVREKGCKSVSLWVGEDNWLARSWYLKLGFQEKGNWGEWIRMKKDLWVPVIKEVDKNKGEKL